MEKVTTYAKLATEELDQILYQDTGIYRPLQFTGGTTSPLLLDSVIEDLLTYWQEPSKMRPGFKVIDSTVYTPIFFSKINGTYKDANAYYQLIDNLRQAPHIYFSESPHLTTSSFTQTQGIRYHNLSHLNTTYTPKSYTHNELDSLSQLIDLEGRLDRDSLKKHPFYTGLKIKRESLQNFILQKLEETLNSENQQQFLFSVSDLDKVRLIANVLTCDAKLLELIEHYDFTGLVPKIVLYLNTNENFHTDDVLLLSLFRNMGLDIILLSPNGAHTIEQFIPSSHMTHIQLECFADHYPLKAPTQKKSFFSKLFR